MDILLSFLMLDSSVYVSTDIQYQNPLGGLQGLSCQCLLLQEGGRLGTQIDCCITASPQILGSMFWAVTNPT